LLYSTIRDVGYIRGRCQDAGPHPPRHAAKKDSMINVCGTVYIVHCATSLSAARLLNGPSHVRLAVDEAARQKDEEAAKAVATETMCTGVLCAADLHGRSQVILSLHEETSYLDNLKVTLEIRNSCYDSRWIMQVLQVRQLRHQASIAA
jgi:hypothetical protein